MTRLMEQYGLDGLSLEERWNLLDELWLSISGDRTALPLTAAQRQDLERRLARHLRDPRAGASWDEVVQRLRSAT